MPGGDGTGPAGRGPRTGWGMGYCGGGPGIIGGPWGYGGWGYGGLGYGGPLGRGFRGRGRMRGGGWGRRQWWSWPDQADWQTAPPVPPAPPMTDQQELELLARQEDDLEAHLANVRQRMEAVEKRVRGEPPA